MSVQVPVLDAADVRRLLPAAACLEAMAAAFRALDRGDAVQPVRSVIRLPDGSGSLYTMPAFLAEPRALAVKMISIVHGNEARGLPTHQGVIVVFDSVTGVPALLIDAAAVTALRTAAVSALATRLLARQDASVLAVLGTGVQARSHIDALRQVRPLRQVRIWGRTEAHAHALAEEVTGVQVLVSDDAEAAVRGADIVCTVTASREPVLRGAWLAPGTHINAVGASTADAREVDSDTAARARIVVDSIEAAQVEAGDLLIPLHEGRITGPASWTALTALVTGRVTGRTDADGITLFKSVGLAIEDAAAAALIMTNRAAPPPPLGG